MNVERACRRLMRIGGGGGIGVGTRNNMQRRAGLTDHVNLGRACKFRDKNVRLMAQRFGGMCDSRTMITTGCGNDTSGRHFCCQQRIERAACFE